MSLSQTITPELRQWIIDQASAGVAAPALIEGMRASGWNEDVAIAAVELVLRAHLDKVALDKGLPPAAPVPDPALAESPLHIDVGDRQVEVLMAMANPRVVLFGNLLSPEECQAIIDAAGSRMARSLTVQTATGGQEVNQARTSDGMFFERGENAVVAEALAGVEPMVQGLATNSAWAQADPDQMVTYGLVAQYALDQAAREPDADAADAED